VSPGKWLTFFLNHANTKVEELGSFEASVILKHSSRRNHRRLESSGAEFEVL